jgi:hypothetical protein
MKPILSLLVIALGVSNIHAADNELTPKEKRKAGSYYSMARLWMDG